MSPSSRQVSLKVSDSPTDGPLSLEPSSTVLHYAQTLFEGMKAYRDENGKVTLFRPDMNMKRMNTSAQRLALPVFSSSLRPRDQNMLKLIFHARRSTEMRYSNSSRSSSASTSIGYHKSLVTVFTSARLSVRSFVPYAL